MILEKVVLTLKDLVKNGSSLEDVLEFVDKAKWRLQVDSRSFVEEALAGLDLIVLEAEEEREVQDLLEAFLADYNHTTKFRPTIPVEALLWDLQEKAADLEEAVWRTTLFNRFAKVVDDMLEESVSEEEFLRELESMDSLIAEADSSYEETSVLPQEVTVESAATDLLLRQGVAEWRTALREAYESVEREDCDWDLVLLQAERANRLLMALQYYNAELQAKVRESR